MGMSEIFSDVACNQQVFNPFITPPDPAERLRVISWYNVNQLGEILDILI